MIFLVFIPCVQSGFFSFFLVLSCFSFLLQLGHVHSSNHFRLHPLQCAIHGFAMFGRMTVSTVSTVSRLLGVFFLLFSVEDPGYLLGELEIQ